MRTVARMCTFYLRTNIRIMYVVGICMCVCYIATGFEFIYSWFNLMTLRTSQRKSEFMCRMCAVLYRMRKMWIAFMCHHIRKSYHTVLYILYG